MNLGHFIPLDLYSPLCSACFLSSLSPLAQVLSASYGGVMEPGSKAGSELSGTISLETILLFLL